MHEPLLVCCFCAALSRAHRSRERHTFVRLMALQYLLERITLTRTDKVRYQSFREKHEHYISDALEKLNDTQRHRLLQHVRGSVQQQKGGKRRLLVLQAVSQQQQQQQQQGEMSLQLQYTQAGAQQQQQQEMHLQLRDKQQPMVVQQQQQLGIER
jgi:hypothetical protein